MAASNTLNIQTLLTPKSTQFTNPAGTKRNNDDDDDGNKPPNPPKRPRQNKNPPIGSLVICEFCKNHPAGQAAHAINRCDWALHGASTLECKNCANYRFQNRGNGAANHQCMVSGGAIIAERIYSDFDPVAFPVQSCQACVRKGFPNSCDVDVLLNYACSTCTKGKTAHCRVNGRDMDPSPRVRLGDHKWYRHACDACIDGHYTTQTQCSWLTDRTVWDHRCNRCDANNQICLQSSNIVERPRAVDPPVSWEVPTTDTVPYADLTPTTQWRKICDACYNVKVKCSVSTKAPDNACERCTQIGIDCCSQQITYPIHDLSRVGFGTFQPFQMCTRCRDTGGNCDRQRPCDSCVKNSLPCDSWDKRTRVQVNKGETFNCCARFDDPPGPLYYLGMGYGPSGVDDTKAGTRIEEWIGPMANIYQLNNAKVLAAGTAAAAIELRNIDMPVGVPPYGCFQGLLANTKPSAVTRQELAQMIQAAWPQAILPTAAQIQKATDLKAPTGGPALAPAAPAAPAPTAPTPTPRRRPRIQRQSGAKKTQTQNLAPMAPPPPPVPGVLTFPQAPLQGMTTQSGLPASCTMPNIDPRTVWGPNVLAGSVPNNPTVASSSDQPTSAAQAEENFDIGQQLLGLLDTEEDVSAPQDPQNTQTLEVAEYDEDLLAFYDEDPNPNSGLLQGDGSGMAEMLQVLDPEHPIGTSANQELNPFLGIPPDSIPDWLHPSLLSRWQAANRLEGLDMRHWLTVDGEAAPNPNASRLFGTAGGQPVADAPSRDVLRGIPLVPTTTVSDQEDIDYCMEPGAWGQGVCYESVEDLTGCQSLAHGNRPPNHFLVCDKCNDASTSALVHEANPITATDIVLMRAYLCTSCAEHIGESPQNAAALRPAGAARVWGKYRNGDQPDGVVALPGGESIEYKRDGLPATGCACATKVFDRRLCRFHRLFYAGESLRQAALMQEWRLNRFGKVVCPACLLTKSAQDANLSADQGDFELLAPTAWACLSCNDWVINQDNNVYGRPDVVPGHWRNGTVDAQKLIVSEEPEQELGLELDEDEDEEMMDMFLNI